MERDKTIDIDSESACPGLDQECKPATQERLVRLERSLHRSVMRAVVAKDNDNLQQLESGMEPSAGATDLEGLFASCKGGFVGIYLLWMCLKSESSSAKCCPSAMETKPQRSDR